MTCSFDLSELREMLEASGEREALREVMLRLSQIFLLEEAQTAMEDIFPGCLALEILPALASKTDDELRLLWQEAKIDKAIFPAILEEVKRLAPPVPRDFKYPKFEKYRQILLDDACSAVARQFCTRQNLDTASVEAKFNELWTEVLREADRWLANDAATKALATTLPEEAFDLVEISLSFSTASWHTRTPKAILSFCLHCGRVQADDISPKILFCSHCNSSLSSSGDDLLNYNDHEEEAKRNVSDLFSVSYRKMNLIHAAQLRKENRRKRRFQANLN
uniref:Uncharacterized protein n=1 Tax=Aureoumbra lagunensis TaxID=44058 RepID=A0A7S3K3Z2_9STRA